VFWINIAGFTIAFLLAFVLLAISAPRRYQVKVWRNISAPPKDVWPLVSDPKNYSDWFPGAVYSELKNGVEHGVGQRRIIRFENNGHKGEREEEVTRWEENRVIILEHLWERVDGKAVPWYEARVEFWLEPDNGGTKLTSSFWFSGIGVFGRIFSLLSFRKRHEKEYRNALDHLEKRMQESSVAA
jgi:uncharacterized protein YndB with AHSA1/START domain